MAIAVEEFWRLAIEGGLFVEAERQDLTGAFDRVRGDKPPDPVALCKWLIECGMLSRYQAKLLMNGRSGPFHFGDFRVYDRVEKGRLSGLFRAGNLHTGQPALLYFFAGPGAQDPAKWQTVEAAANAAIKIKHPHVNRVDELVLADGYKFMVLESLDGRSLAELSAGKPLAPGEVCRYIRKAAAGLARLHNLGHIHSDVRPDNLLVDSTGQLKLLYFPVSCDPFAPAGSDERNVDFLAPERATPHNRPPDVRSDIYALGATTYALLAGRPPFAGGDAADKARRHAAEPLVPLEQLVKTPASLSRLVALMMAKNPQGRPASATEVADALMSIVERKSAGAQGAASAPANRQANAPAPAAASGQPPQPNAPPQPKEAPQPKTAPQPTPAAPNATQSRPPPPAAPRASFPPPAHAAAGQPSSVAPPSALPPGPSWGSPPGHPAPGGPPGVAASAAPPFGAVNPAAPPGPPNVGLHPQTAMTTVPGFAQPSVLPGGHAGPPMGMTPPAMAQAPAMGSAPRPAAPPGYAFGPTGYDPNAFGPTGLGSTGFGAAPAARMQHDFPMPGPVAAAPAVEEPSYVEPVAPRVAPRREATAKRAGRKAQPPKSQFDPKIIGGAVAAGVFIVGGMIAYSMMSGEKSVPIEKSAEMAKLKLEMELAEKGFNDGPSKAPPSTRSESGAKEAANPDKPPGKANPKSDADSLAIVEDDNQTLWASPTSGAPLDLHYVPPGTRMIMALRPAALLQSLEGEKILAALGPGGASARQELEAMLGVPLGDVEQLLACFFSLDAGPPQLSLVARLTRARDPAELVAAWKNPTAAPSNANFYKGAQWAYYLPPAGENKVFSVMPLKEMAEAEDQAADRMDDPVGMGKEMDKLAKQTDAARTFTLLVSPTWLSGPGKPLLEGAFAPLRDPLNDFLGEDVRAVALSLNWGDEFFFAEARAYSSAEGPQELARAFKDRVAQLSDRVDSYVAALNPGPYGRRVLLRFPEWLRIASEYTRVGEDENQAVVRCFLPAAAGHNLLMASELLLSQGGGGGGAVAGAAPKKPSGPAEALKQKITLSFTRDTLEKCMEFLSKEIDTEVVIVGTDLQLEGITKNQSFGLDEKDKPAGEILRVVMLKANPDGKLVYVFKPKEPGGKDIIFITTRASVAKNKYKLPPELEKEPPKK